MNEKIPLKVETGLRELLGEEIQAAADEASTLRIAHLRSQLADYLARVEVAD
jgi:hypothetical protein